MKKLKLDYEVCVLDQNSMHMIHIDLMEVEAIDGVTCIISTKKAQFIQTTPEIADELTKVVRLLQGMVK